jgi:hypothetical protein
MSKTIVAKILTRCDTSSNWTSANPTLSVGEIGIESDTVTFKFGDGVTPWTSLKYAGVSLADISTASSTANGLMSMNDYTKLYNIETLAQVNVIESITMNDVALTVTDKGVNLVVPTGTLASKDEVSETDFDAALTTAFGLLTTATEVDTAISTALESYYTSTEVDAKVSSVFRWQGTKDTTDDLPSTNNTTGDVWHVTADSGEYAWDGSEWQDIGGIVDLSAYATTSYVDTAIANKTTITGNAGTATKLETARTITMTGAVTGSLSFDGSADISITLTANDTILKTTDVIILNGGTSSTTYA